MDRLDIFPVSMNFSPLKLNNFLIARIDSQKYLWLTRVFSWYMKTSFMLISTSFSSCFFQSLLNNFVYFLQAAINCKGFALFSLPVHDDYRDTFRLLSLNCHITNLLYKDINTYVPIF